MLIALFTILLLGGGSTGVLAYIGDSQDAVKTVMEKGDDQKAALSTLKNMEKKIKAHNKVAGNTAEKIEEVFSNHDSTAADISAIWDGYFEELENHNQDILDLRFELKQSISREDWTIIFPADE